MKLYRFCVTIFCVFVSYQNSLKSMHLSTELEKTDLGYNITQKIDQIIFDKDQKRYKSELPLNKGILESVTKPHLVSRWLARCASLYFDLCNNSAERISVFFKTSLENDDVVKIAKYLSESEIVKIKAENDCVIIDVTDFEQLLVKNLLKDKIRQKQLQELTINQILEDDSIAICSDITNRITPIQKYADKNKFCAQEPLDKVVFGTSTPSFLSYSIAKFLNERSINKSLNKITLKTRFNNDTHVIELLKLFHFNRSDVKTHAVIIDLTDLEKSLIKNFEQAIQDHQVKKEMNEFLMLGKQS